MEKWERWLPKGIRSRELRITSPIPFSIRILLRLMRIHTQKNTTGNEIDTEPKEEESLETKIPCNEHW